MSLILFCILLLFLPSVMSFNISCPNKTENCICTSIKKKETVHFKCSKNDLDLSITLFKGWQIDLLCSRYENSNSLSLLPVLDESYFLSNITLRFYWCQLPKHISSVLNKLPAISILIFIEMDQKELNEDFFDLPLPLVELHLESAKLKYLNESLFVNLPKLETVNLSKNHLKTLSASLFRENRNLKHFKLNYNYHVPKFELQKGLFTNNPKLQTVSLTYNGNMKIPDDIFGNASKLQEFYLSGNNISKPDEYFSPEIIEDKEIISEEHFFFRKLFADLKHLKILGLRENLIENLLWDESYKYLKYLNLMYNQIKNVHIISSTKKAKQQEGIQSQFTRNLDLRFNKMTSLQLKLENIHENDNFNLLLDNNEFICDLSLHNLFFNRDKTKQLSLNFGNSICMKPQRMKSKIIGELKRIDLTCTTINYFSNCLCFYDDEENIWKVNCSGTAMKNPPDLAKDQITTAKDIVIETVHFNFANNILQNLPVIHFNNKIKVTEIIASNNSIAILTKSHLTDELQVLDLRNNSLKFLSSDVIGKIRGMKEVYLGSNPWSCDCSSVLFFQSMKSLKKVVVDYDDLLCQNLGKKITDLKLLEVCFNWPIVAGLGITSGLMGILIGLFYKFKKDIKIFLYAHDMCLWFVTEDELDEDRVYDAFFCFAADDQLLVEDIILGLEREDGISCLVGVRDWPPGHQFAELISTSIEQSRRTIVFLSQNFVNSHWCRHEFRAAQTEAFNERRNRIIVITHGDIEETENMDEELKSYLRLHLYIKLEDPRFWQKLRYAMPHRKISNVTPVENQPRKGMMRLRNN